MSFGGSPSDIILVVTFARNLYRQLKGAGPAYAEVYREVKGLQTVLKHLNSEVEDSDSVLNRDYSVYAGDLAPVIGDCNGTLQELEAILQKYGRLGQGNARLWDRLRFGSMEMDQLGEVRLKLINHKTSITVFLDTVQLNHHGKIATTLDSQSEQLNVIRAKVDQIAARLGQRAATTLTTYDDDDKEVWKAFRRELVAEGFDSEVLQRHRHVLRAYIRDIDQRGLLDEMPPEAHTPPVSGDTESWVESVQSESPASEQATPPTFESVQTVLGDDNTKELVRLEDNTKFPQSIKQDLMRAGNLASERDRPQPPHAMFPPPRVQPAFRPPQPSSHRDSSDDELSPGTSPAPLVSEELSSLTRRNLLLSPNVQPDDFSYNRRPSTGRQPSPAPIGNSPSQRYLPPATPSENLSRERSLATALPQRPSSQQPPLSSPYTSSPYNVDSIHSNSRGALETSRAPEPRLSRSPRPSVSAVAWLPPDSNGNLIPANAKWTRIRRALVSPEALEEDRRRYEAQPDFVAVLGLLTREEIEGLAIRTRALRNARQHRRATEGSSRQTSYKPARSSRGHKRHSSTESDTSSSGEDEPHRPRYEGQNSAPATVPIYNPQPAPYGVQPPMTPVRSPAPYTPQNTWFPPPPPQQQPSPYIPNNYPSPISGFYNYPPVSAPMQQQWMPSSPQQPPSPQGFPPFNPYLNPNNGPNPMTAPPPPPPQQHQASDNMLYPPPPTGYASPDGGHSSGREHEHHQRRKHASSDSSRHSHRDVRDRDRHSHKEKEKEPVKSRSRWSENLTAVGIGGAAVSLLQVLSEAAGDM